MNIKYFSTSIYVYQRSFTVQKLVMKTNINNMQSKGVFLLMLGASVLHPSYAQTVYLDNDFGDGTDTGPAFQQVSNETGGGTGDPDSGVIYSGTGGSWSYAAGLNSSSLMDLSGETGFTVEWTVSSMDFAATGDASDIRYNGLFFGVVSGTDAAGTAGTSLFNNNPASIGIVLKSAAFGDMQLIQDQENSGASSAAALDTTAPTTASMEDGFTLSLTINNDNTWTVLSSGLSTEIDASGTLVSGYPEYADVVSALGANTSVQGKGITYTLSRVLLTNAVELDRDDDGMPTAWEEDNGLDPDDPADADIDSDSDGLTNLEEYQNLTDPQDADSDDDGLNDGDEVNGTQNPWTGNELGTAPGDPTDPNDADSDDDGESDSDEITNGTNPNLSLADTGPCYPFTDTDGDSYRDEAELAFGSDPNDPNDIPDHTPNAAKPNIVIIYADDMGFGDMSLYGDLFGTPSPVDTPNLDAFAEEGVVFTQGHSCNGVCTPSRYGLLTGKYNWREIEGITENYCGQKDGDELPRADDVTLPEFLKTQGYDTAAFGKWHLGGAFYRTDGTRINAGENPTDPTEVDWTRPAEFHATANGFDYFRGLPASINFGPYAYMHDDRMQIWDETLDDGYGSGIGPNGIGGFRDITESDTLAWLSAEELASTVVGVDAGDACLGDPSYRQIDAGPVMIKDFENYIADRVSAGDTDPFFAYVALYSPHTPFAVTPEFEGASGQDGFDYGDFLIEVDDRIGRIIDAIDSSGMKENTLILFSSDNGPERCAMYQSLDYGTDPNASLRGAKREAWEGGTRVPFIVRWPGQAAAGMKVNDVVWQGDLFATAAAYLGVDLPDTTAPDAESFLNILRGQQKPEPNRGGIVVCSMANHLAFKDADGWKLIDSTSGGGLSGGAHDLGAGSGSWLADNTLVTPETGTSGGAPKQLFNLSIDLGETENHIAALTDETDIRSELVSLTGRDLLDVLDQLRLETTSALYTRSPDNDGDSMPNSFENAHGLDPDSPADAALNLDGDPAENYHEYVAGTDPDNPLDYFYIPAFDAADADFSVSWPSVSNRTYEVLWSTNLTEWVSYSTHQGSGAELSEELDKETIDAADEITGNLNQLYVRIHVTMEE